MQTCAECRSVSTIHATYKPVLQPWSLLEYGIKCGVGTYSKGSGLVDRLKSVEIKMCAECRSVSTIHATYKPVLQPWSLPEEGITCGVGTHPNGSGFVDGSESGEMKTCAECRSVSTVHAT